VNVRPVYVDSSALLKLVLAEPESDALRAALDAWPDRMSSVLAAIETRRALRRVGASGGVHRRLEAALEAYTLVRMDDFVVRLGSDVGGSALRTLDAIHLGTALSIGDHPEAFVTYDDRLAQAAKDAGLKVVQPGR